MMILKKALLTIIIGIVSFQMTLAAPIDNLQKSLYSEARVERALKEMKAVKVSVRGELKCEEKKEDEGSELGEVSEVVTKERRDIEEEKISEETQEEAEEENFEQEEEKESIPALSEYQQFVESLKVNSCELNSKEITKKEVKEDKSCTKVKGLLSDVAYEYSKLEADQSIPRNMLRKFHYRINKILKMAKRHKDYVKYALKSDIEDEVKRKLLLEYNQNIALSVRDIAFLMGPATTEYERYTKNLLHVIPEDLFEMYTDDFRHLVQGKNHVKDPLFIEFKDHDDGIQLVFSESKMIARDLKTILEFPSAKNYLFALRAMTIQMMVNQVKNYDILQDKLNVPITLPNSCVDNKENGRWEKEVHINMNEQISSYLREGLLRTHGLLFDASDSSLNNFYIERNEIDLLDDVRLGVGAVEFESYRIAKKAVEDGYLKKNKYLKANFDDVSVYDTFMEVVRPMAESLYYFETKKQVGRSRSKTKTEPTTRYYRDLNLLRDILTPVKDGESVEITPKGATEAFRVSLDYANASNYIKHKMIADKVLNVTEIVSDQIKEKLTNNKIVVDLPSMNSPSTYRNWGLKTLKLALESLIGTPVVTKSGRHTKEFSRLYLACSRMGKLQFCKRGKDPFKELYDYMDKNFEIEGRYIPLSELEENISASDYSFLGLVWNTLRDEYKVIPEALTNELDYLFNQMIMESPWARARLSYLIAREELVSLLTNKKPTYNKTRRGPRLTRDYKCYRDTFSGQIERLDEAADYLGLNKVLRPNFVSSFVDNDIAESVFNKIIEKVNTNSTQTFSAKFNDDQTAYHKIEAISRNFVTSEDGANEVINEILKTPLKDNLQEQLEEAVTSDDAEKMRFYQDLAREKDHKARQEMYEARAEEFGIDDDYLLKEEILELDAAIKKPIYEELISRAAALRKKQTLEKLDELCSTPTNDHEKIKEYFYSTLKVQDKLNQEMNLPAVPKDLMERIEATTSEDKWNMVKGIGGFILGAGALALAASCTAITAGICGAAIAVGTAGGMSLGVSVFNSEKNMKLRADKYVDNVDEMADLGMTEREASKNVYRSWAMTMLSTLDVLPLIGIVARGVSMGSKITKEAVVSIYKNASKLGFKEAVNVSNKSAKVIAQEADVKLANLVLGFSDYTTGFKSLLASKNLDDADNALDAIELSAEQTERIRNKIEKVRKLHSEGKVSSKNLKLRTKSILDDIKATALKESNGIHKYVSDVVVTASKADIDRKFAKTLADMYSGDPKKFVEYLDLLNKRFVRNSKGISKAGKAKAKYLKAKRGGYEKGTNWIRTMWNENTYNLAKNRNKFLKFYDGAKGLRTRAELEEFLFKNADDFTDFSTKTPLNILRDIPYLMFQGIPFGLERMMAKVPILNKTGQSVLMRKIANSRARLVAESAKAQARDVLGMKKALAADGLAQIFKGFQVVSREMAESAGEAQGKEIIKNLAMVRVSIEKEISRALLENPKYVEILKSNGINIMNGEVINKKVLKQLLFESNDVHTQTLSDMMWGLVDVEKILAKKAASNADQGLWAGIFKADEKLMKDEFQFIVSRAMDDLVEDSSISGMQRYLLMTKILILKNNQGNVELY